MLGLMLAPLGAVECPGGLTHIDAPLRSTAPAGPLARICRQGILILLNILNIISNHLYSLLHRLE